MQKIKKWIYTTLTDENGKPSAARLSGAVLLVFLLGIITYGIISNTTRGYIIDITKILITLLATLFLGAQYRSMKVLTSNDRKKEDNKTQKNDAERRRKQ